MPNSIQDSLQLPASASAYRPASGEPPQPARRRGVGNHLVTAVDQFQIDWRIRCLCMDAAERALGARAGVASHG